MGLADSDLLLYPFPVLQVRCPWCFAPQGRKCYSKFGSRDDVSRSVRKLPHNSRMETSGAKWPGPVVRSGTGWV